MPCVLRATGRSFEPHAFLGDSALDASPVYQRGEPKLPAHPHGARWTSSGFHVPVSDAGFSDLESQIRDAVAFLDVHENELARLVRFSGVESVCLDFGIARRDVAVQTDSFPAALVRRAGTIGLELVLSHYPGGDENA